MPIDKLSKLVRLPKALFGIDDSKFSENGNDTKLVKELNNVGRINGIKLSLKFKRLRLVKFLKRSRGMFVNQFENICNVSNCLN